MNENTSTNQTPPKVFDREEYRTVMDLVSRLL